MTFFIIHNKKRPLSYFYPNNNFYGKITDIIGFSDKSYITFESREEANKRIEYMFKEFNKMEGDIKISFKVFKILESLKILKRGIK